MFEPVDYTWVMKTIGQILKDARITKNFSFADLEDVTKIKRSFIEKIENEKWDELPAFPTILGFVKSLSSPLDLDEKLTTAVLKRDYPPKKLKINPKPDVKQKYLWSPKMTFFTGIILVMIALFGYLGFQYYRFVSPPSLNVDSPKQNQIVTGNNVQVFGSTDSDAKITVNNQPVLVAEDGKFSVAIPVSSETKEITIVATGRSGKVTTVSRTIVVQ